MRDVERTKTKSVNCSEVSPPVNLDLQYMRVIRMLRLNDCTTIPSSSQMGIKQNVQAMGVVIGITQGRKECTDRKCLDLK